MFRWFKRFLWLCILAGIVAAVVYGFMPKPILVDTAMVSRGVLSVSVAEDGKTRVRDRFVISAPLAGRLHRIKVRAGDPVSLLPTVERLADKPNDSESIHGDGHGEVTPKSFTASASLGTAPVSELAIIDPIDPSLLDSRQIAQAKLRVKALESAAQALGREGQGEHCQRMGEARP